MKRMINMEMETSQMVRLYHRIIEANEFLKKVVEANILRASTIKNFVEMEGCFEYNEVECLFGKEERSFVSEFYTKHDILQFAKDVVDEINDTRSYTAYDVNNEELNEDKLESLRNLLSSYDEFSIDGIESITIRVYDNPSTTVTECVEEADEVEDETSESQDDYSLEDSGIVSQNVKDAKKYRQLISFIRNESKKDSVNIEVLAYHFEMTRGAMRELIKKCNKSDSHLMRDQPKIKYRSLTKTYVLEDRQ
jgi:hypothetical protein